jgi:hypothetical protein
VVGIIGDYLDFESVMGLGLGITYRDLPFEKVLLYAWIKEGLKGVRKT